MNRNFPPPLKCLRCALMEMSGSMRIPRYSNHQVQIKQRQERIEALKPRIAELLAEGMNPREVAKVIDMPRSTVYTYIKELKETA